MNGLVTVYSGGRAVSLRDRIYSLDAQQEPFDAQRAVKYVDGLPTAEIYRTQPSVRTVVDLLATNVAQVALHAYERLDDGDRDRLDGSEPLSRVLRLPSDRTTAYEQMFAMVVDLAVHDRYAAKKIVDRDEAARLVRIPAEQWHFERDGMGRPLSIKVFRPDGRDSTVGLGDALWIDGYPGGGSPLSTLRELIEEETQASAYRRQLWANNGQFSRYIYTPREVQALSDDRRRAFRDQMGRWSAGGDMAGRMPVLEEGREVRDVGGVAPDKGQHVESRKLTRAEVAAAFQVPPVLVGLTDSTSYSNVSAYREILYADVLGPWFQRIQQAFNARVVPWLADPDQVFVEFNVAEKLRMSFDEQARIFQTSVGGPMMTRNEARRRMNLPALPGGDEVITPLNVLVGGQASPTDSGSQNES